MVPQQPKEPLSTCSTWLVETNGTDIQTINCIFGTIQFDHVTTDML